jgi:hypothetical protein
MDITKAKRKRGPWERSRKKEDRSGKIEVKRE